MKQVPFERKAPLGLCGPLVKAVLVAAWCYAKGRTVSRELPLKPCLDQPTPARLYGAGVVKMRRGETATVFETCSDMGDLFKWFLKYLDQLEAKVRA